MACLQSAGQVKGSCSGGRVEGIGGKKLERQAGLRQQKASIASQRTLDISYRQLGLTGRF